MYFAIQNVKNINKSMCYCIRLSCSKTINRADRFIYSSGKVTQHPTLIQNMFKSTVSLYQYLPVPNQEEISKTKIPRKNILKEGTN